MNKSRLRFVQIHSRRISTSVFEVIGALVPNNAIDKIQINDQCVDRWALTSIPIRISDYEWYLSRKSIVLLSYIDV